ncbi:hypothetical protein V6N12_037500 [Hibiscus sabdariffa]|uniref:Uncharacterized protein n=1 Tax=Hibiscus sabdariffa TaxID=183260 RepID=A0ABR2AJR8_9ROSI
MIILLPNRENEGKHNEKKRKRCLSCPLYNAEFAPSFYRFASRRWSLYMQNCTINMTNSRRENCLKWMTYIEIKKKNS